MSVCIFSQYFYQQILPVEKSGVIPHCLLRDSLASVSILLEKYLWNFFTCKASLLQLTGS